MILPPEMQAMLPDYGITASTMALLLHLTAMTQRLPLRILQVSRPRESRPQRYARPTLTFPLSLHSCSPSHAQASGRHPRRSSNTCTIGPLRPMAHSRAKPSITPDSSLLFLDGQPRG